MEEGAWLKFRCSHDASRRFSVADLVSIHPLNTRSQSQLTFQVEEHIRLVVFEHLGDKLDIHIVNIDFLLEG